jgi:hypothetical protein
MTAVGGRQTTPAIGCPLTVRSWPLALRGLRSARSGCRLSAVGCRLSAVGCRLSAVSLCLVLRFRILSLVIALAVAACAYETSGTTTSTSLPPDIAPPPLGPADVLVSDQSVEGSFFVVDRVSMPAEGWVVARLDEGGAPGQVIGISELLAVGVITRVAVPFFVPLIEDTVVHVTLHIDVDRDGRFTYEPPDDFVDEIASRADGEPATTRALITVLPPLSPADISAPDQTTDGTVVEGISATLPAPGFVVVHADADGGLGPVLGVSLQLRAGDHEDLAVELTPPLDASATVHVVAYIDRNADGVFGPGEGADEIGVRDDGSLAVASVAVTVPSRAPAAVEVADQASAGDTVVIARVELPFDGFVEILTDDDGEPGARLGVAGPIPAGGVDDVEVTLDTALTASATLWVRLWVDLDRNGTLSAGDEIALTAPGGDPVVASFEVTME